MKAYKFVSVQDAEAVARGSIRLGTAEEFRSIEVDQIGRGDPNELSRSARIAGGSETLPGNHPTLINTVFQYKGGKRIFPELEVVGESCGQIMDAFLYCCSLSVDRDRRLGGALFEIADIEEFAQRLARRPELKWRQFEHGRVTYRSLTAAQSAAELNPVDPFEKSELLAWQDEYRLLWAANPWERSQIIEAPEVANLLRRLE